MLQILLRNLNFFFNRFNYDGFQILNTLFNIVGFIDNLILMNYLRGNIKTSIFDWFSYNIVFIFVQIQGIFTYQYRFVG